MTTSKEFKSKMTLGRTKALKKSKIDVAEVEKVVEKIHQEPKETTKKKTAKKEKVAETLEPIVKTSVLLPKSLHKKLKQRVLDLDTSVTQYFSELLKSDLKKQERK